MTNAGLGDVTDVSSTILGTNPDTSTSNGDDGNKTGIIIGVVIGSTFVVCLAIIGAVLYMRRKGKVSNAIGV